jgi:predicted extracellular nuclease
MLATSRRLTGLSVIAILLAAPVHAQVVVSQLYGGGGNAGATLRNDFVELFNRGSSAVDLTGWSVQYASATGATWQVTNLSGMIQPGQYYLVQEAQGTGGTVNLPPPDAVGTILMSATAGKVALVTSTTALTGACPLGSGVQDFVGFGATANCSETAPTPGPSNTTAVLRAGFGCTDTDNNSTDFATGTPNPRNTSTPFNPCAGGLTITTASPLPNGTVGQPYSVSFAASGGTGTGYAFSQIGGTLPPGLDLTDATLSGTPTTTTGSPFTFTIQVTDSGANVAQKSFLLAVDPALVCNPTSTIAQIQGNGDESPLRGTSVTTRGVVTGVKTNGFFIQMEAPGDGDPATSDGVFVFTSSAPPAAAVVGNDVCVTGTVQEFVPSQDPGSPPATEISFTTSVFAISSGNPLPPPVVLTTADTDPAGAIDQLEKYEGMRVHVDSLTAVSPTQGTITEASATSVSNGVFYAVITGVARPFREPGVEVPDPLPPGAPATVTRFDSNPERLRVDSDGLVGGTPLDVTSGAVVTGVTGPLDYAFRTYTIDPDPATPPGVSGNATATPIVAPGPAQFTVAAFNVERFFDTVNDPATQDAVLTPAAFQNRLNKVSLVLRNLMRSPDAVGLEEVENLSTLQSIAAKVNADAVAAGDPDPAYVAYLEEGNDIGGIDVGFLVKSSRVSVVDVTQEGKDTTYINPNNGQPELLNDRPSLVLRAEILRDGAPSLPLTVIANHLRSLSGIDDPADGNRVRTKRRAQAEFLANLVQARQTADPAERIVLVGDFNAYQFSDGYVDVIGTVKGTPTPPDEVVLASSDIVNPDLTDLVETVPAAQRYSYSFDGNAQVIDHVLVTGNLLGSFASAQFARVDADFPESLRNDPNRPERISDHDPVVATFNMPVATETTLASSPNPSTFGQPVTFTATVSTSGAPVPVGSVTFTVDSNPASGPTPLNANGQAAFTTSALGPGPHTVAAAYSGAPGFDASSASVTQVVGAAPSQTTLTSSVNPSGLGQPVTFTATVSLPGGASTEGSVTFREGATVLAGPIALDASGHASFTTASLGLGNHTISADYSGTALASPSSASLIQQVRAGLAVSDAFVKEGDAGTTMLSFVVTLTPASSSPVTVDAASVDGTATAGSDYVAGTSHLTFVPGVTRLTVNVAVNGDGVWEDDETLTLRLGNATGASITHGDGVGTILNDDDLPTVRISDRVVREGNAGLTPVSFQVSLSNASSRTVTVGYTTADGTAKAGADYVSAAGSLTFAPGTVSQNVVVDVKGDTTSEPNEFFFLQATSATNAAIAYGRGIAIIINDDSQPSLSIDDVTVREPDAGSAEATFTVRLSAPSEEVVTVDFATANGSATAGSDYTAASGTLVFAPGEQVKTLSVPVLADGLKESSETFFVSLSGASNAGLGDRQGRGTIIDSSAATITGFFPKKGPAGTVVTIYGSGFTGTTSVTFNGTSTAFRVITGGIIRATVPGAASSGPIGVVTPAGPATPASGLPDFTVTP